MRELLVGSEVVATCGKCAARTKHTVVMKLGERPSRVECVVCKRTHDYVATPPARRSADRVAAGPSWADALQRATGLATVYSTGSTYRIGARLAHTTFGEGVVVRIASATVCEVLFEERTVKLVMAPGGSRVQMPDPGATRPARTRRRRLV